MRTRLLGISIAAALMVGAMSAAIPASAAGKATLNVVHGIPGVTVNVCVDGSEAIPDFQPGDVAANVQLPAGSHAFKLVAQSDTCGDTAILKKTTDLDAGKNYTVVANLDDTGAPNLKVFRNSVAKTAPGAARLERPAHGGRPGGQRVGKRHPADRRNALHVGRERYAAGSSRRVRGVGVASG